MQLFHKRKSFLNFFFFLSLLDLDSILDILKKKRPHSWYIFGLTDSEKRG